jgi:hypothetical protein
LDEPSRRTEEPPQIYLREPVSWSRLTERIQLGGETEADIDGELVETALQFLDREQKSDIEGEPVAVKASGSTSGSLLKDWPN